MVSFNRGSGWRAGAAAFLLVGRAAVAFQGTYPVALYSSSPLEGRHSLAGMTSHRAISDRLTDLVRTCSHTSVVLIEHPSAHADDLRLSNARLFRSDDARSQNVDYVHGGHLELDVLHRSLSQHCDGSAGLDAPRINIERWTFPDLPEEWASRQARLEAIEDWLAELETRLSLGSQPHLVIYAGVPLTERSSSIIPIRKRQLSSPSPSGTSMPLASQVVSVLAPSISPVTNSSGIFKKYQLFTSDLILALVISFGLLLPIALVAVHSIASLKTPDRFEKPASTGGDRKQQ